MEIRVPSVGESVTEGTVARWFKKDGETVRTGEPLYELETEKATTEVPSPMAGRLHIAVPEGRTVPIGSVVGQIEAQEGDRSAKLDVKAEPRSDGQPPAQSLLPERPRAEQSTGGGGDPPPSKPGEPLLSPAARRLAKEAGIDPQSVAGTGRGGRVTKEDVLTHLERAKEAPPAPESSAPIVGGAPAALTAARPALPAPPARAGDRPHETRQRMSAIRQRIADRLVAAKNTAAILTTFNEVDLSAVLALRAQYKDSFRERHGIGLGFMSFFVKACVEALKAFPIVNARIDGGEVVYHHFYDIGVAVSIDQGLMVPVVRGADLLSFAEVETRVAALAVKAREGKIEIADLQGGTFTITNGGVFGSLLSTPILNAPQSAILGMHAIQKRPVALGEEVVIRPMMYVALSYDHRLIDGREAVQFLVRVKQCIESPERLLLEV